MILACAASLDVYDFGCGWNGVDAKIHWVEFGRKGGCLKISEKAEILSIVL